ncbi:hypothetical protein Mal64_07280 [Pseudobythopirellula maris]|uniref:YdhG-like domain-containing protein n=1 Tax=Pseudobythopirellula maris TaxID=2527991 RepID=A0A5C5ZSW2_9BACT|nr:DUF1801 domain-containing protein [Pseudobythopirellula maris]TWT90340.1 hypothetical protein Mal64_07280 [Pseudobythopirellula maris]
MSKTNPQVDAYFKSLKHWRDELEELRAIALDRDLTEELKWRSPCYTVEGKNVAILGGFKEFCTISFFKGALLKDHKGLLDKPGKNSRAARLIRFTSVGEIVRLRPAIEACLREAIAAERAGLKVEVDQGAALELPAELVARFDESPALRTAFEALTPGRQRGYAMHFAAAKQSKTRTARIEKYEPRILQGKGFHDCTCGLTKSRPAATALTTR